jgi:pyruvate formate lyase activating enzyme
LLQPNVTTALLKRAREDGIHTALDTTGFAKWEIIESVLPYVDLVLFDVKVPDNVKHKKWTGVSNTLILENLKKIAATGTPIRIRSVNYDINFFRRFSALF